MTIEERIRGSMPGLMGFLMCLGLVAAAIYMFFQADRTRNEAVYVPIGLVLMLSGCISLAGLFANTPNQARVCTLFGRYTGTVKKTGWHWVNPFHIKRKISLRVRNFETERLKINDLDGNPIEIATVVVWRVVDTAEACFEVDDYENYVHVQSESALRNLGTHYPFDTSNDEDISLRGSTDKVAAKLRDEVSARLAKAGVEVIEARISHLAYAPEIAQAMLRRQQAGAIIAARQKIVEGAVGMVQMALEHIQKDDIVEMDEERKATMVSNLLVVLCSETATQPVVNTGSLYT